MQFLNNLARLWRKFSSAARLLANLPREIDDLKMQIALSAKLEGREREAGSLLDSMEYRVFSQWGDDGIIAWLVEQIPNIPQSFVEIGVEDYRESTTRYLLMSRNWKGWVWDGSTRHIQAIQESHYYWRHELHAHAAFVSAENIDDLLTTAGVPSEPGLLHIDIDGMDYWVWKSIESIRPQILILEYNALFGAARTITVPYDPSFQRFRAHASGLYFGASLRALVALSRTKGYAFVGSSSSGNNAYFVRTDLLPDSVPEVADGSGFSESLFRESRDPSGKLTFLAGADRIHSIRGMPVIDVATSKLEPL